MSDEETTLTPEHEDEETPHISPSMTTTEELEGLKLRADIMALTGDLAGRRFTIEGRVHIGRDPESTIRVPGDDVSRRHAVIWKTSEGEFVIEDLKSRNGTLVNGMPIEVHVLAFGDKIQIGSRSLFVFTHHQALEEQLIQWQRMELIAQMTAGLVHDFNNYMAALLGYIQYVQELSAGERSVDKLHQLLESCLPVMESAAREGSNLAQKVLTFARARKRPQSLINITPLIEEAVHLVRRTLPQAVRVEQHLKPNLRVNADRTELLQVLINLLLNARDAMPQGGTLRIEAASFHLNDQQAQEVGLAESCEAIVLKVMDTGIGMEEETRKRVFEPLFTTKSSGRGTGLGLSMVYRIIESQHGQILVDSAPGKGSQFTIYLPVAGPEVKHQHGKTTQVLNLFEPTRKTPKGGGVVLVLDSEPIMRQRTARALNTLGFEMVAVASPMELVDLLHQFRARIKLIILNLESSNEDGATTYLRLQAVNPEVKVLFTTTTDKEPPRLAAGKLRYLKIPCNTKTFQEAITEALS